jgi:PPOX class probable F420-dependent enzyme
MDAHALIPAHAAFLTGRHFATVATLDEDGAPRQTVVWYARLDDGRILINSRHPRRWCRNLLRDGRVALAITEHPYRWLGLTGIVDEVVEDVEHARDDIVALARRYSEDGSVDPKAEATFRSQPRVTFLIRITGVHDHLER